MCDVCSSRWRQWGASLAINSEQCWFSPRQSYNSKFSFPLFFSWFLWSSLKHFTRKWTYSQLCGTVLSSLLKCLGELWVAPKNNNNDDVHAYMHGLYLWAIWVGCPLEFLSSTSLGFLLNSTMKCLGELWVASPTWQVLISAAQYLQVLLINFSINF